MNKLVTPLTLDTAIWCQVLTVKVPPVITLDPLTFRRITPEPVISTSTATSGLADLKSKIFPAAIVVGRTNASTAKSPVPKPKSDDVANDR